MSKMKPDDSALRDFLLGHLSAIDWESVKQYLEEYPVDSDTLEALARNDTFIEQLRDCSHGSADPSPLVSELMSRLEKLPRAKPADTAKIETFVQSKPLLSNLEATDAAMPATGAKGHPESLDFLSPSTTPDELGQLGGHRILRILGSGGMGMVFEARDGKLDRRVALKVMRPNVAQNATAKDRFLREAKAAAAIEDDHIISIFHVGEANGVPFLTMPMLKGESLDDRIKKLGTLPVPEVLRIGREIAQGLAAAHEHGLIHRDIKPANIWLEAQSARVGGQSRVKILDFGLARSANPQQERGEMQLTQSGTIMGTPAYMAPEQARGLKVDTRTDLFSLGVVLYRMSTGQLPFKGNDTVSQLLSLATDTPTHPSLLNPSLPYGLTELIVQLLEKDPAARPVSAQEIFEKLRVIETESSISTPQPPARRKAPAKVSTKTVSIEPVAKKTPSRRWIVAASLLLLLIGGGFAAYQLIFKTKDGTLIVEVQGDDQDVRILNGELRIHDPSGKLLYTLKPSEKNKTLPPGKYRIEVAGADGLKLDTDHFEITRDGKTKVHVSITIPEIVTKKDPPKNVPLDPTNWVSLFNGKDLKGWHESEATKAKWQVTSDMLIGSGEFGYLITDRTDFENFRVRVEAMLGEGADSGLCFRVQDNRVDFAYEAQIGAGTPKAAHTGSLVAFGKSGAPILAEAWEAVPPGRWFTMEVLAENNRFTIWVDGKETVQYEDMKKRYARGAIALQQLGPKGNVSFRKIEIKELPKTKNTVDPDRRAAEWVASARGGGRFNVNGEERDYNGETELPAEKFFVTSIEFWSNKQATAEGLKNLAGLTKIERLILHDIAEAGKATEVIGSLTSLRFLQLEGSHITDEEFKPLRKLTNLNRLALVWASMTDAALGDFEQLTSLDILTIGCTKMSWAKLAQLKNVKNLKHLRLVAIAKGELVHFKEMPRLEYLAIQDSAITDNDLVSLKTMPKLTQLLMSPSSITDADLEHLKTMKQLTELDLRNNKVTAAGVKKLAATLPNCKIVSDHGTFEPK